ncbi:hypothetical protein BpHYR1_032553 [Brachionus plicatilis]|uniref:Uncharacterized protein n=1 Tax=Brachionus plicatilis TaxID=10195 RepID=A0A3M7PMW0_BRAPC|nr:hypothetical protein BpHYR1_032553 [Brachionus plicatilis]
MNKIKIKFLLDLWIDIIYALKKKYLVLNFRKNRHLNMRHN